jgi:hypothetical protein
MLKPRGDPEPAKARKEYKRANYAGGRDDEFDVEDSRRYDDRRHDRDDRYIFDLFF